MEFCCCIYCGIVILPCFFSCVVGESPHPTMARDQFPVAVGMRAPVQSVAEHRRRFPGDVFPGACRREAMATGAVSVSPKTIFLYNLYSTSTRGRHVQSAGDVI